MYFGLFSNRVGCGLHVPTFMVYLTLKVLALRNDLCAAACLSGHLEHFRMILHALQRL